MKNHAILLSALSLTLGSLHGQTVPVPPFINYQGKVTDGNNAPLGSTGTAPNFTAAPVNRKVIFRFYDAAANGNRLWSEQQTVTISLGEFSVLLGQGTQAVYNGFSETKPDLDTVFTSGAAVPGGPLRYLEVVVDNGDGTLNTADVPITPRQRINSTPYSFRAGMADTVPNSAITNAALATGSVSAVKIADNAVTTEKIVDGAISNSDLADNSVTANKLAANIGVWTAGQGNVSRPTGNVGIRTSTPNFPLSFGPTTGEKISLFSNSADSSFGFGMAPNELQIQAGNADSKITFGYGPSATMTRLMTIGGNGNVGIGTETPDSRLHVNGDARITGTLFGNPANSQLTISGNVTQTNGQTVFNGGSVLIHKDHGLYVGNNYPGKQEDAGSIRYKGFSNGLDIVGAGSTASERKITMWAEGGTWFMGNVGIRTSNPEVPLDVATGSGITMNNLRDAISGNYEGNDILTTGGAYGLSGGNKDSFFGTVSIRAANYIASGYGFVAYSDRRIKKDLHASEPAKDLAAIDQLRVTDYRMVDPANGGNALRRGFIAQEVEQVIPGAVKRAVDFVPDIFAEASVTAHNAAKHTLGITLNKDHTLKAGDRVRLHMDGKRLDLNVAAVPSSREFVVEECEKAPEKVFVYGRQVNDFRSLDYDTIFTTGISAIQELSRKVDKLEAQQAKFAALETKLAKTEALEKENTELRTKLEKQETRLVTIERMLEGGSQPASRKVSLKATVK